MTNSGTRADGARVISLRSPRTVPTSCFSKRVSHVSDRLTVVSAIGWMLVTTPTVGAAMRASRAISPGTLMPISTTAKR